MTPVVQPDNLSIRVAEEIRALLARRRMSGRELARRLDVSPGWVSFRLTGTQPIDLNDLERIAGVLGVTIIDLLPPAARQGAAIAAYAHRRSTRPADRRPPGRPATPVLPRTRPGIPLASPGRQR